MITNQNLSRNKIIVLVKHCKPSHIHAHYGDTLFITKKLLRCLAEHDLIWINQEQFKIVIVGRA